MDDLVGHANPFATLVVAHLASQRTRQDVNARMDWKRRLLRSLRERPLDDEDRREWARYYDWLLPLPREMDASVYRELSDDKEETMPYVTSWERMGEERGELKATYSAVELGLDLLFGAEGVALMPEVRQKDDIEFLNKLVSAIRARASLDELRAMLRS